MLPINVNPKCWGDEGQLCYIMLISTHHLAICKAFCWSGITLYRVVRKECFSRHLTSCTWRGKDNACDKKNLNTMWWNKFIETQESRHKSSNDEWHGQNWERQTKRYRYWIIIKHDNYYTIFKDGVLVTPILSCAFWPGLCVILFEWTCQLQSWQWSTLVSYIKQKNIWYIQLQNCVVWLEASEGGNSSQTGTECVEPGEELPEVPKILSIIVKA